MTVTGIVDPNRLINKLEKSGKHAELWGPSKNFSNQNNMGFNNQLFKNIQFENGKFGKSENKSHNDSGNKGGHQHQQQQQLMMKGLKDMKMGPNKEQKTVKFKIPVEDEFNASGDDYDDEFGDDDDDLSGDEFADEFGHGHHQKPLKPTLIGGGQHGQKGSKGKENNQKKGGSGGKKGSLFDNIPFLMKGLGMKGDGKKHGNGGKKGGGGGGKSKGGGEKGGGKTSGFFGDFDKNGDFGEVFVKNKGGNGNGHGGGGGNNNNSGGKKAGGKHNDGSQANHKAQANFKGMNNQHASNHQRLAGMVEGDEGSFMSQMGSMGGPMGNYPASQMVGMPAVQGLPAMNGGYYQNPYQQQYMGMMMNQHQQHQAFGNGMYQPMMYARPPQPMGYVPPMPPPASDPYVNMFSDENTGSCSVM